MQKSLAGIMVLVASLVGLAMTMNLAAAVTNTHDHTNNNGEIQNEHIHTNTNDKNGHTEASTVINIGGKDGSHLDTHCIENSNNDQGQVCRTHVKDRG
jgi:hypothetical protein